MFFVSFSNNFRVLGSWWEKGIPKYKILIKFFSQKKCKKRQKDTPVYYLPKNSVGSRLK